jgi:acyl-CoA synthetase (AMP-forming)/AMP-acid ligase II
VERHGASSHRRRRREHAASHRRSVLHLGGAAPHGRHQQLSIGRVAARRSDRVHERSTVRQAAGILAARPLRKRATITSAANFAFKFAAETISPAELEGISLAKMRAFWNTGERVAASSYARFHDRFGAFGLAAGALCANYGLAENSGGATFSDVGAAALRYETVDRERLQQTGVAMRVGADDREPGRVAKIASLGAPWPGLAIEIRDESGHPSPDGATGEIALRSPARFLGYCNDPSATAAALDRGVLLSGDLGYVRGGQLFWTGRKRESIVVRGRKIDPGEFLPVLEPIEGLRSGAFAAFGVDDERSGTQRVVIVAELQRQDGAKAVVREIRRAALSGLGVAADDVLLVAPNTLVTTISGKRRHSHYKALYLKGELELLRLDGG